MKFGPRPLEQAVGLILAHNMADQDGRRLLRKGSTLSRQDLEQIRQLGWSQVYVAELETGDLTEDEAALRIGRALAGPNLNLSGPTNGRANLHAQIQGVFRLNHGLLAQVNGQTGVTVATLAAHKAVPASQLAATIKIIPYGLAASHVEEIEGLAQHDGPVLWLDALNPCQVHLVLQGSSRVESSLRRSFVPAIKDRLKALGSSLEDVTFTALDRMDEEAALASALRRAAQGDTDLIIVAGETAIMDEADVIPQAVRAAGGRVEAVGAPVDPGNLLMLAYLDDTPILGAPGCARSPKENVIDWLLPRLLAGEQLSRGDITSLGAGGLLAEIKERPMPRRIDRD